MPTFREDLHLGHHVPTVEADDIAIGAITEEKMADDSVSTRALQDKCVTEPKIDDNAVSERTIQDGAVTEPKLADESVSNRAIQDDAVDGRNIKPGSIENRHLAPDAVTKSNIADKSVTPSKISDDFKSKIVFPYTEAVDNKYSDITRELYQMINSLQVGGIALSGRFGNREDIGIHQKSLTKFFGYVLNELSQITGKSYMDYTLTVEPVFIIKEGTGIVNVTADCSSSICNFDSIKLFVDDVLKAESQDETIFTRAIEIEDDGTHVIKAVGVIAGMTITKQQQVRKILPFFMGSGQNYTDVMVPECQKELVGTLEGDYDVTIKRNGDYMFIIIPISHRNEFRRADMNGLGLKVEIPMNADVHDDFVVYKSLNTYQAGVYNIDIDINS